MEDLIRALQIFLKYHNGLPPTHCEHDILLIANVSTEDVTPEDHAELEKLGFFVSEEFDCYASFRFGSA